MTGTLPMRDREGEQERDAVDLGELYGEIDVVWHRAL